MSLSLTAEGRISTKPFAKGPAIPDLGLDAIVRAPGSVSNLSAYSGLGDEAINFTEGCFITKTIKYTHQLIHWFNAVRNSNSTETQSEIVDVLDDLAYSSSFCLNRPGLSRTG